MALTERLWSTLTSMLYRTPDESGNLRLAIQASDSAYESMRQLNKALQQKVEQMQKHIDKITKHNADLLMDLNEARNILNGRKLWRIDQQ